MRGVGGGGGEGGEARWSVGGRGGCSSVHGVMVYGQMGGEMGGEGRVRTFHRTALIGLRIDVM